ncbi:hypothetical protein [Priestia megaterium]|nr:hypothetical protein [Priestia megaterium]
MSTMHKKFHDSGKESLVEAYRPKGSFAILSIFLVQLDQHIEF